MVSEHSIVVLSKEQVSVDLDEEAVILNLKSGEYFGLDAVGIRIWNLIREPRGVREIRDVITEEYEVEPGRCGHDLLAFLDRLAVEGLIQVKNEKDR